MKYLIPQERLKSHWNGYKDFTIGRKYPLYFDPEIRRFIFYLDFGAVLKFSQVDLDTFEKSSLATIETYED